MRGLANYMTASRILAAFCLLFTAPFSAAFYGFYLYCSLSDMADGAVARKTHTESRTGAYLDSVADLIFVAVCLVRLLPVLAVPRWLWVWMAVIVLIKIINVVSGWVCWHRIVLLHTTANRLTGFLLFLTPLLLLCWPLERLAVPLGMAATFAAIQEGHFIRTGQL